MSNIRPIADPSIATAMLATMQSIDAARSAPSGISDTRWRILQCIAKAAPNVPSPGELRMCSGLSKAALAEHVQALQWKGLLEMGGYRLSPSAAAMVGLEQPYPPSDAKAMTFAEPTPLKLPDDPDAVVALRHAISAMGPEGAPLLPYQSKPTIIGVDMANRPDVAVEAIVRFGADGAFELVKVLAPLDPADVPACMRPDCTAPVEPIPAPKTRRETKKTDKHGRGGAAVAHPLQGGAHCDRVAPDRTPSTSEEVAGSNPAPGQPAQQQASAPTEPPKFTSWIDQRHARIAGAIAFLKSQAILVSVVDRDAPVRQYFVAGKRYRQYAEEVIEIAIAKGWAE
ncbi:hypothetical protein CD928_03265 [Sphingopyxis sp. GW247-27LB]|nr:hypothetical protein CD928_03265 [Sphingopyxis sp. GW247-27LB]